MHRQTKLITLQTQNDMKTTTAIKNLEKVAEKMMVKGVDYKGRKYTLNNVKMKKEWSLIMDVLTSGKSMIRPCSVSGVGRFATNMDYTSEVCKLLDAAKIKYVKGNDAPRGGLTGNYVLLTHINK